MLITADQLLAHAIGDYVLQSDWMATAKTQKSIAALAHALTYTLPFLFLTSSWMAFLLIAGSHFAIDRWRLARYVVWAKNFLAPRWIEVTNESVMQSSTVEFKQEVNFAPVVIPNTVVVTRKNLIRNHPWSECSATGYHKDRPPFLSVWLLIIADNILHVILNGIALKYL